MFFGELADGLQHRKPGPPRRSVGDQKGLANQTHRVHRGWRTRRRHPIPLPRRRFGGQIRRRTPNNVPAPTFRCRPAGHRTNAPRDAVCGGVPAPGVIRPAAGTGDRADHAPRWPSSTAMREAASSMANGNPVEALTNLHHCGRFIAVGQREARRDACSAFDEQRRRRTSRSRLPRPARAPAKPARRRRRSPSRLVAKDMHGRGMRKDGLDQVGGGVKNVLAIVEHQQPRPAFQRGGHRLTYGLAGLLGDAQHRGHRVGH